MGLLDHPPLINDTLIETAPLNEREGGAIGGASRKDVPSDATTGPQVNDPGKPRTGQTASSNATGGGDETTSSGELSLTVGELLPHLPTEVIQPGMHDADRLIWFRVADLSADIARGRASILVSKLAEICPYLVQLPEPSAKDISVRLPLQKLVEQLSAVPRPVAVSPPQRVPPRVMQPEPAPIKPPSAAETPVAKSASPLPLVEMRGDLIGSAAAPAWLDVPKAPVARPNPPTAPAKNAAANRPPPRQPGMRVRTPPPKPAPLTKAFSKRRDAPTAPPVFAPEAPTAPILNETLNSDRKAADRQDPDQQGQIATATSEMKSTSVETAPSQQPIEDAPPATENSRAIPHEVPHESSSSNGASVDLVDTVVPAVETVQIAVSPESSSEEAVESLAAPQGAPSPTVVEQAGEPAAVGTAEPETTTEAQMEASVGLTADTTPKLDQPIPTEAAVDPAATIPSAEATPENQVAGELTEAVDPSDTLSATPPDEVTGPLSEAPQEMLIDPEQSPVAEPAPPETSRLNAVTEGAPRTTSEEPTLKPEKAPLTPAPADLPETTAPSDSKAPEVAAHEQEDLRPAEIASSIPGLPVTPPAINSLLKMTDQTADAHGTQTSDLPEQALPANPAPISPTLRAPWGTAQSQSQGHVMPAAPPRIRPPAPPPPILVTPGAGLRAALAHAAPEERTPVVEPPATTIPSGPVPMRAWQQQPERAIPDVVLPTTPAPAPFPSQTETQQAAAESLSATSPQGIQGSASYASTLRPPPILLIPTIDDAAKNESKGSGQAEASLLKPGLPEPLSEENEESVGSPELQEAAEHQPAVQYWPSSPVYNNSEELSGLLRVRDGDAESAALSAVAPLPVSRFDQESLQALFMTEEILDVPALAKHVAALPGIQATALFAGDEAAQAGEFPPAFDLQVLQEMGVQFVATSNAFGRRLLGHDVEHVTIQGGGFSATLFARAGLCLCVIHRARGFLPGVREKLAAVADELAKAAV